MQIEKLSWDDSYIKQDIYLQIDNSGDFPSIYEESYPNTNNHYKVGLIV